MVTKGADQQSDRKRWMVKPFILKTFLARLAGLEPATHNLENRIVVILIVPPNEQILSLD